MLMHLFAGLFHKRCPLCKQEVHGQANPAVQRFGKWCCSETHADLYELELYEALRTVYCRHARWHGQHVPLPAAVNMACSPRPNLELACQQRNRDRCFIPPAEAQAGGRTQD
jgi:hypothetical protein